VTPERRRRWLGVAGLAVIVAALGGLATVTAEEAVVYYRTPTEAVVDAASDGPERIGGLVVVGSVRETEDRTRLELTDGATRIDVELAGPLPAVVREGEGAVVHGHWVGDVFVGEEIVMRHSNEYRAPEPQGTG
jgi:cytochrome c-type biogenesis protein CcmE